MRMIIVLIIYFLTIIIISPNTMYETCINIIKNKYNNIGDDCWNIIHNYLNPHVKYKYQIEYGIVLEHIIPYHTSLHFFDNLKILYYKLRKSYEDPELWYNKIPLHEEIEYTLYNIGYSYNCSEILGKFYNKNIHPHKPIKRLKYPNGFYLNSKNGKCLNINGRCRLCQLECLDGYCFDDNCKIHNNKLK